MILIPVSNRDYDAEIRVLFSEYIHWVIAEMNRHWNLGLSAADTEAYVDNDIQTLDRLLPPNGRFYLAQIGTEFVGVGSLKRLNETTGEIKRMFVRPQFRGQSIGKRILDQLLADARTLHYDTVYLDSPTFSENAHRLYQSRGFYTIDDPYPGNENPAENTYMVKFMRLDL